MKKNKLQKGYTLIETIVYLSIFALVSVLVINSFITVSYSYSSVRSNNDLLESGSFAMERMSREIRQAKTISVANSTLSSSPGVLELNSTDSSGNAFIVKFSVSNGALNVYENNTLVGNILGSNVSVTNLVFRRITTTKGEAVKIEMTLQDTRSKTTSIEKFYDTVILRGAYSL